MLQRLLDELGTPMATPIEIVVLRLVGAVVLCGLIGLEREMHKNTAGLRTYMLIGASAAVLSIITLEMIEMPALSGGTAQMDPMRLVSAVTSGIAFLAAGVVVYTKGDVKGLTTGAGMWLAGAIGLAAGQGLWPLALVAAVGGVLILWALRRIEVAAGLKDVTE